MMHAPRYASAPLDCLARCGEPHAPALILRDRTITYGEFDAMVGRLAAFLRQQGFAPGDRVATWLPKTREACLMPLAAVRAGLVHVPVNPLLKPPQVAHILADSGARLLLTSADRAGQMRDSAARLLVDAEIAPVLDHGDDVLSLSHASGDTLAALLYTSGSTGRPKGVMLSHANLWLGAESVATYLGLGGDDRTLAVLPLSFDYGQNQLLSTWYAGGAAVPFDYLLPRDVIKACARHGITTLAGVPPLWVQLMEQPWDTAATAYLRRVTNSGGVLTRDLIAAMQRTFPKAAIFAMYGLTEAFRSTCLDPALIDEKAGSIGKAIPYAEILCVRPDGGETAAEEVGELVHCGPLVAQGYWQDAARTAERFRPAPAFARHKGPAVWSGDSVRRDAEGFFYFVGREDAMIKSAGNRISPSEIEEAALASGVVAECASFGVPDRDLGQAIILVARAKDGESKEDAEAALRAYLKQMLPNFMQPRDIRWQTDLPRNPNGKLDRVALAEALTA